MHRGDGSGGRQKRAQRAAHRHLPEVSASRLKRLSVHSDLTNAPLDLIGQHVKFVADFPLYFLPRLDIEIDERFRAYGSTDGPKYQLREGVVGGLAHPDSRLPVLYTDIVIARRIAEAGHQAVHRLAFLQFLQVCKFLAARFGRSVQIGLGMYLERESHAVGWPRGLLVQHVEVVLVDAGGNGLLAGIPKAVFQHQFRFTGHQPHSLLINVCIAQRVGYFVGKLDRIGRFFDGPLPVAGDVVGLKLPEGRLIRFADRAHADLYEALARFGFLIAQARPVSEKFLDRPHDGIVDFWIVSVEPFAKIFMPLELKT